MSQLLKSFSSLTAKTLGYMSWARHTITLTDLKSVRSHPYRVSSVKQTQTEEHEENFGRRNHRTMYISLGIPSRCGSQARWVYMVL